MFTVLAALIAVYGLAEIFTKKLIGRSGTYTEESVARYAPIEGLLLIVCGFAVFVISISGEGGIWPETARMIALIVLLLGAVADIVMGNTMLEKAPDYRLK